MFVSQEEEEEEGIFDEKNILFFIAENQNSFLFIINSFLLHKAKEGLPEVMVMAVRRDKRNPLSRLLLATLFDGQRWSSSL